MIDYKILDFCLTEPKESLFNQTLDKLSGKVKYDHNGKIKYRHIDRGGKVLAVAHLDHVVWTPKPVYDEKMHWVNAGQLDDRLGVYAILHHLQQYTQTPYDILLTDDEEKGQSTAKDFTTDKEYNWIFEFDRSGDDIVMYGYSDKQFAEIFASYGLNYNHNGGSFTDIVSLDHLKVKGFNIGTEYYCEHTTRCYATLADFDDQVRKFANFLDEHHEIKYPHEGTGRRTYNYSSYQTSPYGWSYDDDDYYDISPEERENYIAFWEAESKDEEDTEITDILCPVCSNEIEWDINVNFCSFCGSKLEFDDAPYL